MDAPLMQIGGVTKESMDVAAETIIKVATCSPIPKVALKALETLQRLGETKQITIQYCTLTSGEGGGIEVKTPPVVGSDYRFGRDEN